MLSWDDYWKNYKTSHAEKWLILERNKVLNNYLDKCNSDKKNIVEIGCGFGSNIRLINEQRDDTVCYALDNSEVSVEKIKPTIKNSYLADCRDTKFEDEKFDIIFSSGLMEHFRDETPLLDEWKRILKKDGYLVTFIPARISLWQLYQLFHFGSWIHGYEKSYTYGMLKKLFLKNNFKIKEIMGIDPFSINGFTMKLLNKSFEPTFKKSFIKSGYQELGIIVQK